MTKTSFIAYSVLLVIFAQVIYCAAFDIICYQLDIVPNYLIRFILGIPVTVAVFTLFSRKFPESQ